MEDAETYKKMLARDERRFRVADQDGDSMATREELTAFLHPEEFPHMRDIVVAVSNIVQNMFPKPVLGPSILHKDSGPPPCLVPIQCLAPLYQTFLCSIRCPISSLSPGNHILRRDSCEHQLCPGPGEHSLFEMHM